MDRVGGGSDSQDLRAGSFWHCRAGTLGNAGKAPDKGLASKLRPLVKALRDSDKLVQEAATDLDAMEWDAAKLCRGGGDTPTPTNGPPSTLLPPTQPDPLDQLIACARALTEDVRQVASFIQVSIQWAGTALHVVLTEFRERGLGREKLDDWVRKVYL